MRCSWFFGKSGTNIGVSHVVSRSLNKQETFKLVNHVVLIQATIHSSVVLTNMSHASFSQQLSNMELLKMLMYIGSQKKEATKVRL